MNVLINVLLVLGTVALMEFVAYATHRWVMHGPLGWRWHKSHHEETHGPFEKNDLYAVCFAVVAIALFAAGSLWWGRLTWIATGVTLYGLIYFIVHDGLVHQRWPFRYVPRKGYLRRLYQAHRLHHAVEGREGCVSFGFIYAPPVPDLKRQLQGNKSIRPELRPEVSPRQDV
ncbi:sterol desaturase family protein [Halodurantibacterium flavum]|uniref:Sterol desaturase family protein n=1 Tax=Halodurantibacterium flavum TaxID=1382802 RepID=A0ABW4S3B3_9RHOB